MYFSAVYGIFRLNEKVVASGFNLGDCERVVVNGNNIQVAFATMPVACNDLMAMGALRAVHECSLRVPQDVAVVGYDDIELASYTQPPLSTVAQPVKAMAQQALAWLLQGMQADKTRPATSATQLLVPALVTRASSKPVARPSMQTLSGGVV